VPLFFHDIFLYGDGDGFSIWRGEHQAEHTQFVVKLTTQSKPHLLADLDFISWEESANFRTRWLVSHEATHEQLRAFTGVAGVNLADVDLTNQAEFYTWLDAHRAEHVLLRAAFGIT
jgi:hypothetical protein